MLPRIKYIRPNSVLAFRGGLLAKWLRVRARVRVRAWAKECTSCVFFFLWGIIIGYYKCGEHLHLRWFGKCATDNL